MAAVKPQIRIRFHNPNSPEATADAILKLLIQANEGKLQRAIDEYINASETNADSGKEE